MVALLIPGPLRMTLPPDMAQLLLFLLSAGLAMCVVVAFSMLIYTSAFYTLSASGVRIVAAVIVIFWRGLPYRCRFFRTLCARGGVDAIRRDAEYAAAYLFRQHRGCGRAAGNRAANRLADRAVALGRLWMRRAAQARRRARRINDEAVLEVPADPHQKPDAVQGFVFPADAGQFSGIVFYAAGHLVYDEPVSHGGGVHVSRGPDRVRGGADGVRGRADVRALV